MRKLSMKRKSKTNENNADSNESEQNNSVVEQHESDAENGVPEKKSKKKNKKGRKSKNNDLDQSNGNVNDDSEEQQFEIQEIIDEKITKGVKYFLIRWKGYGQDSDSWEPEDTLNCPELLAKFLDQRKGNKKDSPKKHKGKSPRKSRGGTEKNDNSNNKDDDEEEYEVDRIIDVYFKKNGKREFLVHWKGYPTTDNTWEPEENMNCHVLIEKYMEKVNKAKSCETRELRVNRKPTDHFTLSMHQNERRLSRRNIGKQRAHYVEAD